MLNSEQYQMAADCLKMLAQPLRLQIIDMLLKEPNLTVSTIAERLDCSQNLASEHLKLLRLCNFVDVQREGRIAFYFIIEPHLKNFISCIYKKFGETK